MDERSVAIRVVARPEPRVADVLLPAEPCEEMAFEDRFCVTYGADAIAIFQELYQNGTKMAAIGSYFGFSRKDAKKVRDRLIRSGVLEDRRLVELLRRD